MSKISLSVNYIPQLSTGPHGKPFTEHSGELHVFLSKHLLDEYYQVSKIDNVKKYVTVILEFQQKQIPSNACVGFAGHCKTYNSEGKPCKITAGYNSIDIVDLMQCERGHAFEIDLVEH